MARGYDVSLPNPSIVKVNIVASSEVDEIFLLIVIVIYLLLSK